MDGDLDEKVYGRVVDCLVSLQNQSQNETTAMEEAASFQAFLKVLYSHLDPLLIKHTERLKGSRGSDTDTKKRDDQKTNTCEKMSRLVKDWVEAHADSKVAIDMLNDLRYHFQILMNKQIELRSIRVASPNANTSRFNIVAQDAQRNEETSKLVEKVSTCFNLKFSPEFPIQDQFMATARVLAYIQERLDYNHPEESLQKIFARAAQTYRECAISVIELTNSGALTEDYVNFPRIDVVREVPMFRSYQTRISRDLPGVRTELARLNRCTSEIFGHLRELESLFKNSYYLDAEKVALAPIGELSREYARAVAWEHSMSYLKRVYSGHKSMQHPSSFFAIQYIHLIFRNYRDISKTPEFEQIGLRIAEMVEATHSFKESLKQELEDSRELQVLCKEGLSEWRSKPPVVVSDEYADRLPEMRMAAGQLGRQAADLQRELLTTLAEACEKCASCGKEQGDEQTELLPRQLEEMMTCLENNMSEWKFANARLGAQKSIMEEHMTNIEETRERIEAMKREVEAKKALLEELKKKGVRTHHRGKQKKNVHEICMAGLCPLCRKRPREVIISRCCHTFCAKCMRTESHCPSCCIAIEKSDVHEINWN